MQLTGEAEVDSSASNRAGDMDGAGLARLSIDPVGKKICYDFTLRGLEVPLMAHIHRADAKHIGPTVVTLFTGPGGDLADCVRWTEVRLAEIVSTPSNCYVNVYTTEYPDGALRGQLMGSTDAIAP